MRLIATFVTLALCACGSRSGLPVADRNAGGGTGGGGTGGVAPMCFTPGEVAPVRPIGAACAFDGDSTFGVYVASGGRLYGVDGSGIAETLYQFGTHWPFEGNPSSTQVVESRGGYTAAAVAVTPKGHTNPAVAAVELALLDASGTVLHQSVRSVPYKGFLTLRLVGNDRGIFALSVQTSDQDSLEIVGAHGEHYGPLAAALPVTDPDSTGRLCILREHRHHWLDPCTGRVELVRAEQQAEYTNIETAGAELTWVQPSSAAARLETVDGLETLALPLSPTVSLFSTHPSGWQLVSSSFSLWSYATANVRTAEARAMAVTIPTGLRRFGSFGAGVPGFDNTTNELGQTSDGSIVLGMRDDSVGALYRTSDGINWNPLGFPVGKVWQLIALERSGTFLIAGTPTGFTADDWASAPPDVDRIDYQQMQLVRPPEGVVLAQATLGTGFTRGYSLSADGGCAGTLLGETLEITSAVTLQKTTVTLPEFTQVYGAWTFAPGPSGTLGMN